MHMYESWDERAPTRGVKTILILKVSHKRSPVSHCRTSRTSNPASSEKKAPLGDNNSIAQHLDTILLCVDGHLQLATPVAAKFVTCIGY